MDDEVGGQFIDVTPIKEEMAILQDLYATKLIAVLQIAGYAKNEIEGLHRDVRTIKLLRVGFQLYMQGALDALHGTRDEKKQLLPVIMFMAQRRYDGPPPQGKKDGEPRPKD